MKNKNWLILLICLFSPHIYAHTIQYDHVLLKHWELLHNKATLEGSFYMLKNGEVYIENAQQQLLHYPLTDFSTEDLAYIARKEARVNALNSAVYQLQVGQNKTFTFFNFKFFLVFILLIALGFYFYFFTAKNKIPYLIPIWSAGVLFVLFSFTTKFIHSLQSTTNPLFVDSAFTPFKPSIYTRWDSTFFYVESKGIPTTHPMMVGISNHGWQQQVPIPQCYIDTNAWPIPLNPVIAINPIPVDSIHFTRGAIAIAVNGVPIFNVHTNTGVDSYLDGQLDNYGGHCGRGDDYHYHIAPLHLYNYTAATLPIAFGLDGFAVYGNVEPDGSAMLPLDANHGHFGSNGVYHYHGTATAPYMIAKMAGEVTEDTTHQLIPQAHAHPVRPGLTPLSGALITGCQPNTNGNGYSLTYTLSGQTDSVVYNWTPGGIYTFQFFTQGNGSSTTQTYNGFSPCTVPTTVAEIKEAALFDLYPNPANNVFYLHLNPGASESAVSEIVVYNAAGKLMYSIPHFQASFSTQGFSQGMYLVKIKFQGFQATKKLLVE